MSRSRNPWFTVSLALSAVVIILGFGASYYYLQFSTTESVYRATLASLDQVSYEVDVLVNYGNGTFNWFNNTRGPIGWNLYNLTSRIASIDSKYYPQFQSHFINGINGVGMNKDEAHKNWFWTLWIWGSSTKSWKKSPVGSDGLILSQDQAYAWYYQDASGFPNLKAPG